jgi:predicted dehydrogenase
LKAKEILDNNDLGKLIYFKSSMYVSQNFSKGKGWRYNKSKSGGGVLSTLATHIVDLLLWYFGDVSLLNGHTNSYYSNDVEDFVHSYFLFGSGLEGYLDASWSVRNYRLPEITIEIHGENGVLIVSNDFVKIYRDSDSKWNTYYKQDLYNGVYFDLGGPEYTKEDMHMVESVKNKTDTGLNVYDGLKVQKVVDGIYKSSTIKSSIEGGNL